MGLRKIFVLGSLLSALLVAYGAGNAWDTLIEQGHFKQARALLEKAASADANDATALMQLAFVELEFNAVDAATKHAEKAVALRPKDAQAHAILADCYGQAAENAGIFHGLHLSRQFRKENDAALAIDPKNYEALHSYMQFYLEAPGIAGGDKVKAQEMADRIAAFDPAKGARAGIEIALNKNETEHLEELYQKPVQANPQSYDDVAALASLYAAQKWRDLPKAEDYARRSIKIDPGRGLGYAILAQVMALNEHWNQLDQVLEQAERAVPDNLIYYFRAGRALLSNGKDNERAERYFRKYLTQTPEANTPTLAQAHWQLGLVLEKQNRKQEAVREVETALQLNPQLKGAKDDLKRMKS